MEQKIIRLTIEDYKNNFEPLSEKYFNTVDGANKYLHKCFPYSDKKISEDSESCSFCILHKDNVVVGISAEIIYIDKGVSDMKAWDGRVNIFEVFNTPDVMLILEKYNEYISDIKNKEDYVDSYRIGLIDDAESMEEYETLITCCGSDNTEVVINGVRYMFGCNFGH